MHLTTKGKLAIQVPGNYDSPIQESLKQLSERPDWAGFLFEAVNAIRYRTPEFYYDVLSAMNLKIDLWTTTYYHILDSVTEIIEWYSGTGMRPHLDALPDDDARAAFVTELTDLIQDEYPKQADGKVIFPFRRIFLVPRRFQWYIAEGMLSLPTAKWSMVISFFSGVMASGFAFGCAKDTVEFFNAGIGEVRFPVGEGFLLVIFDYVGPWV